MYIAICARRLNGRSEAATLPATIAFNHAYCAPPLKHRDVQRTVASIAAGFRDQQHLNLEKMASRLKVTPDERTRLRVFLPKKKFANARQGNRKRAWLRPRRC